MSAKTASSLTLPVHQAVITGIYGAFLQIRDLESLSIFLAKARGKLRIQYADKQLKTEMQKQHLLTVGDIVTYQVNPKTDSTDIQASVLEVLPRKNSFSRSNFNRLQTLGANIDQVAVLLSFESPRFNHGFLDRLLVEAGRSGIYIFIVVNKQDVIDEKYQQDPEQKKYVVQVEHFIETYRSLGYDVYRESLRETISPKLKNQLVGKTTIFLGQSGVGKSTFLNQLAQEEVQAISVNDVFYRGQHTTTNSLLFLGENNSRYIDTPGVREFGLQHLNFEEITRSFREFNGIRCGYANCSHSHEPDCAVKSALDQKLISEFRYESYRSILASLDQKFKPRKGDYWRGIRQN